jgi:hypothetical protein
MLDAGRERGARRQQQERQRDRRTAADRDGPGTNAVTALSPRLAGLHGHPEVTPRHPGAVKRASVG